MQRIWRQFGRHMDILILFIGSIFAAGTLYANANTKLDTHEIRLTNVEKKTDHIDKKIDRMDGNLILVMRKLEIKPLPMPQEADDSPNDR